MAAPISSNLIPHLSHITVNGEGHPIVMQMDKVVRLTSLQGLKSASRESTGNMEETLSATPSSALPSKPEGSGTALRLSLRAFLASFCAGMLCHVLHGMWVHMVARMM